jgi:4-alpha-glucanotransferase
LSGGNPLEQRASGVLMHPTSLPGPYGCGDMGPEAYRFADFLADARQRWWQTLPISPADKHGCPYSAYSAFAGDPLLISPQKLYEDGLLTRTEIKPLKGIDPKKVDYPAVHASREPLLRRAYENFLAKPKRSRAGMDRFQQKHKDWLDDWSMFSASRFAHRGKPWTKWTPGLRRRKKSEMACAREAFAGEIAYSIFLQYQFDKQWTALKKYCNGKDVGLIGDIPIFVAHDSCDVWAHPELFQLKTDGTPKVISGAAPDAFSKIGQLWKHPLYDWPKHKASGYGWWVRRFRHCLTQYDAARIDHFLGFCRYWEVPAGDRNAKRGRWRKSPGKELFTALKRKLGSVPIIAEDLGLLTPEAAALRDRFGFPGMRVLQTAFGEDDSYHAPHNCPTRSVIYTGTHDNDTVRGWFASAGRKPRDGRPSERQRALAFTGGTAKTIHHDLVRLALSSPADTAIFPVQDLLGLDSKARMNTPGTLRGNWTWRLKPGQLKKAHTRWLADQTTLYGRA